MLFIIGIILSYHIITFAAIYKQNVNSIGEFIFGICDCTLVATPTIMFISLISLLFNLNAFSVSLILIIPYYIFLNILHSQGWFNHHVR